MVLRYDDPITRRKLSPSVAVTTGVCSCFLGVNNKGFQRRETAGTTQHLCNSISVRPG
ncbi:hypothetical protein K503DRAFT_772705 [Rhizopogon vinicolor AM-OR11-026]|uniref:Uncharacterized protein n=1 Tax=Rhizopogon vinicolor AM-OR11-026 TaxID=1314800 RepID=A0A1B7MUH8_9AGAM|nr:hypothetical protein K503DRAFT_772705 [Rhizopogon vinicolor AM-OR11-026]